MSGMRSMKSSRALLDVDEKDKAIKVLNEEMERDLILSGGRSLLLKLNSVNN